MRATKDTARGETINLRASRRQKVLIDRAAETLGRSRSDFMLETACREAESVLLDRRYFALSAEAFKRFVALLDRPAQDNVKLALDADHDLVAKLLIIRTTTKLGVHQERQLKVDGRSIMYAIVPNEWATVYGRIVRMPRLNKDCGSRGCGGDDVPVMIIAEAHNVHRLREDGRPLPEDK